jgi:hypothetical protein
VIGKSDPEILKGSEVLCSKGRCREGKRGVGKKIKITYR